MDTAELGRKMMELSGDLADDRQCCDWARLGHMLTLLGTPKMPKTVNDLKPQDQQIVMHALRLLQAKKDAVQADTQ